jgi:cytochrome c oxidase subunit 4
MKNAQEGHQLISYGTYIMVWLALLIFTGLTVTAAGLNLRNFAILVALLIAAIKSYFVMSYFMHLKFERPVFRNMVYVTMFTLAIIMGLTFIDTYFR